VNFSFNTSAETQIFAEEVATCIARFGATTVEQGIRLVNEFFAYAGWAELDEDNVILHDGPYYLAQSILHHPIFGDNRPKWWEDPKFWPPPKDYKSKW